MRSSLTKYRYSLTMFTEEPSQRSIMVDLSPSSKVRHVATELLNKTDNSPLPINDTSQQHIQPKQRWPTLPETKEDSIPDETSLFVTDNESTVVDSASMDTAESSVSPSPSDLFAPPPTKSRIRICPGISFLVSPRSSYEPFVPPALEISEAEYLIKLRLHFGTRTKIAPLRDFVVYCDHPKYPMEMKALNKVESRNFGTLYFDSVASVGDAEYFLRRVPIKNVRIGTVNPRSTSIKGNLCLHSQESAYKHTAYLLRSPASEYQRFYEPFLWVAQLSLYFVAFLKQATAYEPSLDIFRWYFADWVNNTYRDADTAAWMKQHPSCDFRTSITSNRKLLMQQATVHLGDG